MKVLLSLLIVLAVVGALPAAPAHAATTSGEAAGSACAAPRSADTVRTPSTPRAEDEAIPPENDWDCDEVPNDRDNCTQVRNNDQSDVDGDGFGDRCDDNADNDPFENSVDTCPLVADQENDPRICQVDNDRDGTLDNVDNCRRHANPDQLDTDRDGYGDVCDGDDDDDYDLDYADNCALIPNPDQADGDADGIGDACDPSTSVVTPPSLSIAPTGPGVSVDQRAPALTVRATRTQRRSDAAGGMPLWVRCSEACALTAEVRISARDARRLGIARSARKPVVVAAGEAAVDDAGSTYVFFDVTRAAARRLFKRSGSVSATLELLAVDAAGNRAAPVKRALRFRR